MMKLLFGIALTLVSGSLVAQEAGPPVFTAGTEAVLLDMVVRDEDGRLVPDLRAEEVQVFEDGKLCTISSFRLVRAEDSGRPAPDLTGPGAILPTTVDLPSDPSGSARRGMQPPDEGARSTSVEDESLHREGGGADRLGSVVLLVFDHLGRDAASRARGAALDMIARPFPDHTWFAVLKVGQRSSVLKTFTEDRTSLVAPIERATTGADRSGTDALSPGYASAAEEALALAFATDQAQDEGYGDPLLAASAALAALNARMEGLRRGEESLYPLVAITRALQTVRGRKTMLYFSEGLPVPEQLQEVFWSAISEANRSNLTVYGFDARGLSAEAPGADAGSVSLEAGATAASPWTEARAMLSQLARRPPGTPGDDRLMMGALTANAQHNLRNLSEGTGGLLVANTNDLGPGLERVAADLREYYEIAYVPPNPVADGEWRSLEVKVSRPGVKVRARKGYFALPPGAPVVRPSELPLTVALDGEALPREVPLRAAALYLAGSGTERDVLVALKVPLSAATFESSPGAGDVGEQTARLSLLARVRDPDGRLLARMSHDTPLAGTGCEVAAIRAQSLVVKRALRLAPGRYTLEAAVLDRGSSRVGASRVAFEVPAATGLSLGSLTVVRPEPLPEGGADLLRAGDVRGTPRLGDPIVAAEGEVVGVFLSLQPGESPQVPGLTLEVRRDGEVVSRSPAELPPPDASGRVTYLGQLPARAFEPGRYVLHARVQQGAEEVTTATSFRIVAPEPGPPPPATALASAAPPEALGVATRSPLSELPPDVAPLLEAAGRYVVDFQDKFRNIVAEETYRQWTPDDVRTLESDVVFVTLPGDVPWVTFRDVFKVNGQEVRDRDSRLEALFMSPDQSTLERAEAIREESARFNLGPTYRDVNVPTLALVMLHPLHRERLRWERRGSREFDGHTGVEVRGEEVVSPTLVRQLDGSDVTAWVSAWIEEETGRVLRTEAGYRVFGGVKRPSARSWVNTRYRPDPSLALWVPDEMYERYEHSDRGPVEARARYSNHRRFQVETSEERARLAGEGATP